jgi:hypothetical protein
MKKKKIKLKPGDILSFKLPSGLFGFARVLAKPKLGDAIEVFDYFSANQEDYKKAILAPPLFEQPVILDGYTIFWKNLADNWYLIAKDNNFIFDEKDMENVKFRYGVPGLFKLIDLNDVSYLDVPQEEAEKYPDYSPYSNQAIIRKVEFLINKKKK